MEGITLVKSDSLTVALDTTEYVVVDLGLGIDEAARILGISLAVYQVAILIPEKYGEIDAVYSFDPEDTTIDETDDEQFVHSVLTTSAVTASTGAQKQSEVTFFDFSRLNLITTRNLAFIAAAKYLGAKATGRVYYEKYKPTDRELVTLIAQRR